MKINNTEKFQLSLIKNIIFLVLIGTHGILFIYFLIISNESLILTTFELIFSFILVSGALYTFLVKNPYYFHFYIGIIVASILVVIILPISLVVLIPELVFLYLLTLRGPSPGQIYTKMKASKQQHLPYYDLAVTRMYGMSPGYPAVKMDEVWNPDSTNPIMDKEKDITLKGKHSMWKVTIISIICTIGFLITSALSLILYFL